MKEKLYEITNAMTKVQEVIEDPEELKEYFDSLSLQLEDKAGGIMRVIKNEEMFVDKIDSEIKRLQERKASFQRKIQNVKDYVSFNMKKNKISRIETDIATFSFRKSTSVKLQDDFFDVGSSSYMKEKIIRTADKIAIKKDIQGGFTVPGAELIEKKNLQIK